MRRIFQLRLVFILICSFSLLSCGKGVLRHGETDEKQVFQLLSDIPSSKSYPDADILYALDEMTEEVFEDGRCRRILHTVFKIVKDYGKEYANVKIGFNSRTETATILFAKTTTPEGEVIPLRKNTIVTVTPYADYPSYSDYKELTFSMPGATVGSVIDYAAVIEEKVPEMDGRFSSSFNFQAANPVLLGRYKIVTPKNMQIKYRPVNPLRGEDPAPRIEERSDKKVYLWEYKNIPQIIREKNMPPLGDIAFSVMVTTITSWDEFSVWWRRKVEGKTDSSETIRAKVADLTRNLLTPEEKIEALFDYVKREVRYVSLDLGKSGYEPASARDVFKNKYGDCKDKSTLLISMLRTAGIPAHHVLIPTHGVRGLTKAFPYPFQFNHCIVALEKDGGDYFLDPVAEDYRFNSLPGSDQNRDVLIFKDKETLFATTRLAEAGENAFYVKHRVLIGSDGSIKGEAKSSGTGGQEASLRSFLIYNNPTEVKEALEKDLEEVSPGAKLVKYVHSNPLNFKEGTELTITYDAPDYSVKAGDILIFHVPEIPGSCVAADKETRRYPIVVRTNSLEKREVKFGIPSGYDVYYLPEPVEIANDYFEYRSGYQREGDKIIYQGEFRKKAVKISPEEYSRYQRFCTMMGKSFKRPVLFREAR
jgi:transglutaminase-like putative cysteine protease